MTATTRVSAPPSPPPGPCGKLPRCARDTPAHPESSAPSSPRIQTTQPPPRIHTPPSTPPDCPPPIHCTKQQSSSARVRKSQITQTGSPEIRPAAFHKIQASRSSPIHTLSAARPRPAREYPPNHSPAPAPSCRQHKRPPPPPHDDKP